MTRDFFLLSGVLTEITERKRTEKNETLMTLTVMEAGVLTGLPDAVKQFEK